MNFPRVGYDLIHLLGGWDQSTPTLELASGFARDALNFECSVTGGYTRIGGYERFDGRTKPSDAVYSLVFVSSFTYAPVAGDTITGATSGATGRVIATGAAGSGQYIAITMKTGNFATGEVIRVGASTVGTSIVATMALDAETSATYTGLAADAYRANITAVPGSGPALGYALYNDIVYAFRANAGGTAVDLYKSSAAGWVNVPFYKEVYFAAGTNLPAEGATLTQGGVTATIKRVVLQSGAWTGSAAGKLIITTPAGGNFAAGAATSGTTTLTLTGAQLAITLIPGGKFECVLGNFFGGAATNRVYGADGMNRAFEFDGDVLVPIDTGAAVDTPKHIAIHKNMLMLSIGTSLMYSAVGLPYNYTALAGAGEIGVGEAITALKVLPGSSATAALLVTSRGNTYMLYGTTPSTFNFVTYNSGAGALDYSVQNMSDTYMMDDRGVVSLKTSLNYGNFDQLTLTYRINSFINQHKTKVSASSLERRSSQYRLFFSDGYGLYITSSNGQPMGVMPVYYPNPVYYSDEGKLSNGEEASFFCSTNGFVYQMDKGSSFDGAAIDAYVTLNYNPTNSPRVRKRYRKAAVEISGNSFCKTSFGYNLGYGASAISQSNVYQYASNLQQMVWDGFTWDSFTWDGKTVVPNECEMVGTAENCAITIRSGTPYYLPFTINSIIVHYSMRRGIR